MSFTFYSAQIILGGTYYCFPLLLLSLPLICLIYSTIAFKIAVNRESSNHGPPTAPYAIPFLCHALALAWDPCAFIEKSLKECGWRNPLRAQMGMFTFTIISNPFHIQKVFKHSKHLSSKRGVMFALKYLLNTPKSALPGYEAYDSGMARSSHKGGIIRFENRIHYHQAHASQKFLSDQHLVMLSQRYAATLRRELKLEVARSSRSGWVDYPDLYQFLQMKVAGAGIETILGSKLLEMNPHFIQQFWAFDTSVPKMVRGYPRWLIPGAYKARYKLLQGIKAWHIRSHKYTDCSKIEDDDPEWEPHFGSKLTRARQNYSLRMDFMNADARASEDLGLLMASNGNTVPCAFWFLYEALKNRDLFERLALEVTANISKDGLPTEKMLAMPLLQSVCAEVLRLYVATAMIRQSDSIDFPLGGYQVPKGEPFVIFSRHPAYNQEAWAAAGRWSEGDTPLAEFSAERFLVPGKAAHIKKEGEAKDRHESNFSLEGLAGLFLPFGGGQHMCPGRHFAKAEIICTFALMVILFDIELLNPDAPHVKPDLRWFPTGAMPPVREVPFRIRRRDDQRWHD